MECGQRSWTVEGSVSRAQGHVSASSRSGWCGAGPRWSAAWLMQPPCGASASQRSGATSKWRKDSPQVHRMPGRAAACKPSSGPAGPSSRAGAGIGNDVRQYRLSGARSVAGFSDIPRHKGSARKQQAGALDQGFQLSHVAGPGMGGQRRNPLGCETGKRIPGAAAAGLCSSRSSSSRRSSIRPSAPEPQAEDGKPEMQVLAEQAPAATRSARFAVGRGDQPEIDLHTWPAPPACRTSRVSETRSSLA